ncbi:hypothetical protein DFH08DRAFT_929241 [Mycena albidolilacea]|uniref:Uncharacterized protein n=1 Tax=Mycena albidolilacea TaxID=1033008 RepID=A0AAD7AR91_9AGAR|nr:hypothetical protein DFH08DRAFT_929241 [Mycena albidolilacea]
MPSRSTPRRREPNTAPRHLLHAMLAFLAAHVASSPSRTPWLFSSVLPSPPDACACCTPWHLLHHLLRALCAQWSFPIAGAVLIASSRAKCVSNKLHSPRSTHPGRIINTARITPLSRSPSLAPRLSLPRLPPPCPTPHYPPLKPSACPAPEVRRAASPERAASATSILVVHAAFNASPRPAPASSAPTPVSTSNLGRLRNANTTGTTPRDAQHTLQLPPSSHTLHASHVHHQCHTAPFVDDSTAPPPMRGTLRASVPSPAPATSAAGWQYKRGWGTATRLGATNPGGERNLRCPGISDRTAACAVRISGERCEHGEGYRVNAAEFDKWACIVTLKIVVSGGILSPIETRRIEYAELEQASDYRS